MSEHNCDGWDSCPNPAHRLTLTNFLLARIAEDEAVAGRDLAPIFDGSDFIWLDDEPSFPALIVDPARVLAECEAKRRIVDKARDYSPELEHGDNGEWAFDAVLCLLALPYADHPDYREEWGKP